MVVNPFGGSGETDGRDGACTPKWLADLLGHFDFDPCSNPRSHILADIRVIGEHGDDGLCGRPGQYGRWKNGEWKVVTKDPEDDGFYNPPYARGQVIRWIRHWAHAMNRFTFLLRWDPSTTWFSELLPSCTHLWFPRERIEFEPPPGVTFSKNPFPHALYLRDPPADRLERLSTRGWVLPVDTAGPRVHGDRHGYETHEGVGRRNRTARGRARCEEGGTGGSGDGRFRSEEDGDDGSESGPFV